MKTTKTVTREVVETDEVRCNKCGELCTTPSQERQMLMSHRGTRDWYGLIEAKFTTGYFSDVLNDMQAYTFSLCEPCVKELMESFTLPAEQKEYNFG